MTKLTSFLRCRKAVILTSKMNGHTKIAFESYLSSNCFTSLSVDVASADNQERRSASFSVRYHICWESNKLLVCSEMFCAIAEYSQPALCICGINKKSSSDSFVLAVLVFLGLSAGWLWWHEQSFVAQPTERYQMSSGPKNTVKVKGHWLSFVVAHLVEAQYLETLVLLGWDPSWMFWWTTHLQQYSLH